MRFNLLILLSIYARAFLSINLAEDFGIQVDNFLKPFLTLPQSGADIFYHDLFEGYMNIEMKTKESFSQMIKYLYDLEASSIKVKLEGIDFNTLENEIFKVLVSNKRHLKDQNLQFVEDSIKIVLRDYLIIEMIQDKKLDPHPFDMLIFQSAVNKLMIQHSNSFNDSKMADQFALKLQKFAKAYIASAIPQIKLWTEFRLMLNASIMNFVKELVNKIKLNDSKIKPSEFDYVSDKIIELLNTLILIHRNDSINSFDFAYQIGSLISSEKITSNYSSTFFGHLFDKILKLFAKTNNIASWKLGKQLLSNLLVPEYYSVPTQSYQKFMIKKYTLEGIKLNQVAKDYRFMVKCYHIDLIHTSLNIKKEMFEADDIKFLFNNFKMIAQNYQIESMKLFNKWREFFMKCDAQIDTFYSLFNSLYDALIHGVEHYLSEGLSKIEYVHPAILLDEYIDVSFSHEQSYISYISSWTPDQKIFNTDIRNRYFFYKFINLVQNIPVFEHDGIKFQKFVYSNDVLIHKYTLEHENKILIDFYRNSLSKRKMFNYNIFSEETINGSILTSFLYEQDLLNEIESRLVFE